MPSSGHVLVQAWWRYDMGLLCVGVGVGPGAACQVVEKMNQNEFRN